MSNLQILGLALISLTGAIWLTVKRSRAAAAPAVLAAIMLLLAFGGPLWEWSKQSVSAGLPSTVKAIAFGESRAVSAFLWASIGASTSALLLRPLPAQALRVGKPVAPPRNLSAAVVAASATVFIAYVCGAGPSFLKNDTYLYTDGILFLNMAAWPSGLVIGLLGIVLVVWEEDRLLRYLLIFTSALWFIGPLCVGSRTVCAGPVLAAGLMVYNEVRRRRIHLVMIATALALFVIGVFSYSVVMNARVLPHGLLNIPSLVRTTAMDMRNTNDSSAEPAKQLLSSVFQAFPIAEESVYEAVDPGTLIDNANPLPGTARSAELERYWPYSWIPLSFAGEWFAAMGSIGQVLIFGAMGLIYGLAMQNLERSRFSPLSFLSLAFVGLVGVLSIEYSSRMVWRILSLSVLLLIASYLVREKPNKEQARLVSADALAGDSRNEFENFADFESRFWSAASFPSRTSMKIGVQHG